MDYRVNEGSRKYRPDTGWGTRSYSTHNYDYVYTGGPAKVRHKPVPRLSQRFSDDTLAMTLMFVAYVIIPALFVLTK